MSFTIWKVCWRRRIIAIPDSKYGEVPMAVVRRENEKITEAGIKAWVKKRMAKFQGSRIRGVCG